MRVHGDRAGPAARRVGRWAQLGLVRPFPRKRGANGEGPGVACLACPLPTRTGRRTCVQHPSACTNGEEPGVAYPRVPPSRVYGQRTRMHPSARMGKAGGSVPSRTPFPGGVPACNSLPREWGRVGLGVACPRIPRAYVATQPREKGGPGGWRGGKGKGARATRRGGAGGAEGSRALACPLRAPPRMRKGGPGDHLLLHAPFSRVQGGAAKGKRRGWRGWGEGAAGPVHTPSTQMGKGGARGGGPAHASLPHVRNQGGWGGTEGGVLSCAPLPRKWDREGEGGGLPLGREGGKVGVARQTLWRKQNVPATNCVGVHSRSPTTFASERGRKRAGRRPLPPHRAQRGAHEDKGHTMPAAPWPPGPSLLPHPRRHICAEGGRTRAHKGPLWSHHLVRVERACDPPAPPFPIRAEGGTGALRSSTPSWPCPSAQPRSRGQGACEGTPPHHSESAPPLPSCPRHPIHVNEGMQRQDARKGDTRGHATPRPLPSPFVRKGGARGHTTPPLCVARAPFPFPPRHPPGPPFSLGRVAMYVWGMRGHTTPGPTLPHSCGRELHAGTPPGKGVREGTLPPAFPIRAEGCTRVHRPVRAGRGHVRHATPGPSPFAPRLRGKGCTRPSCARLPTCHAAGPVRSPCTRIHRTRTPFLRAIVRLRQNIDVA
ncbi:hypothetical protein EDB89DRAFT_1908907 [Lactarius sanguifluus]|nr:hypothetical protein EDB89DRAFT_1908907 [Lactarius sanguifluus]